MKERPILMSGLMVCAILAGRKTQTRRTMKKQPNWVPHGGVLAFDDAVNRKIVCPYGEVGDRLWVREAWCYYGAGDAFVGYRATDTISPDAMDKWRPSIFMPRKHSRILLEITNVRVQRLQDISEDDAIAEGICKKTRDGGQVYKYGIVDRGNSCGLETKDDPAWKWDSFCKTAKLAYARLWYTINGAGSWEKNKYVWVVEFKVL